MKTFNLSSGLQFQIVKHNHKNHSDCYNCDGSQYNCQIDFRCPCDIGEQLKRIENPKPLGDIFVEKIKLANKMELTQFVFNYGNVLYITDFDGICWSKPQKITKL